MTPVLTIGDVAVTEGDVGTNPARLTVNLSTPVAADTVIAFATADGTATSGADYTRRAGKVRIRAGRSFATIAVRLLSDTAIEGHEAFAVTLADAGGIPIADATGTVTLRDDDPGYRRQHRRAQRGVERPLGRAVVVIPEMLVGAKSW